MKEQALIEMEFILEIAYCLFEQGYRDESIPFFYYAALYNKMIEEDFYHSHFDLFWKVYKEFERLEE